MSWYVIEKTDSWMKAVNEKPFLQTIIKLNNHYLVETYSPPLSPYSTKIFRVDQIEPLLSLDASGALTASQSHFKAIDWILKYAENNDFVNTFLLCLLGLPSDRLKKVQLWATPTYKFQISIIYFTSSLNPSYDVPEVFSSVVQPLYFREKGGEPYIPDEQFWRMLKEILIANPENKDCKKCRDIYNDIFYEDKIKC